MLTKCPDCNQDVSDKAPSCIHCGCPLARQPSLAECLSLLNTGPKCPLCGGPLAKIVRGKAFAEGNLLGAFTKTHQCKHCGHLV